MTMVGSGANAVGRRDSARPFSVEVVLRIDAELAGVSWFVDPASASLPRLLDLAGLRGVLADPAVN